MVREDDEDENSGEASADEDEDDSEIQGEGDSSDSGDSSEDDGQFSSMVIAQLLRNVLDLAPQALGSRPKYQPQPTLRKINTPRMVPMQVDTDGQSHNRRKGAGGVDSSFGQRRRGHNAGRAIQADAGEGGAEISWVPSSVNHSDAPSERRAGNKKNKNGSREFTLERGGGPNERDKGDLQESERKGRTKRRTDIRSGSRNVFRRM